MAPPTFLRGTSRRLPGAGLPTSIVPFLSRPVNELFPGFARSCCRRNASVVPTPALRRADRPGVSPAPESNRPRPQQGIPRQRCGFLF
jgi:hypothetical protein